MTKAELIAALANVPDDTPVILDLAVEGALSLNEADCMDQMLMEPSIEADDLIVRIRIADEMTAGEVSMTLTGPWGLDVFNELWNGP